MSGFPTHLIAPALDAAFAEDLGLAGDITTNAIIPAEATTSALLAARKPGRIAGLPLAEAAFRRLDPDIGFRVAIADGEDAGAGAVIAEIQGSTRAILTAERIALNFLGHLSGIATHTRAFAEAIAGTSAHICCTRKTTPGLRAFEKYAVRMGDGMNHRFGLFDAVLIKDNHIAAAGGIGAAIERARRGAGHLVKIEVEVDRLDQLEEALRHKVDAVLLDNMSLDELRRAVAMAGGRVILEASGGVSLASARGIAETGVDLISSGALTHSSPTLDLGLDFPS
ncbi:MULTISPECIES: carboxylating nicotinate-nucleotide diphosphorylase [Rhodomicrobium]|uniref:carboxylating nicotinate-nucleotide diphosphorylase n=1 Tax=Rhodomicrobium TaxID=1068 RepID=UPI000B4B895F|nr:MULTISPECIES: carboxylating nicotinate-nucleotide diphosphorylase [Rhodomicrobium]